VCIVGHVGANGSLTYCLSEEQGSDPTSLGGRSCPGGAWSHRVRPGKVEVPPVGAKPRGEAGASLTWDKTGGG